MSTPTVARLAAFMEGLARADAAMLKSLAGASATLNNCVHNHLEDSWRAAAFRELQGRYARFVSGLDFDTVMDIARGELDAREVARHVLAEMNARNDHPNDPPAPPPWEAINESLRKDLVTVAHRFLGFNSLELRDSAELDYRQVGCLDVRDALIYAFFMGARTRDAA